VNRTARFAVIERYLAALRQLGDVRASGEPLRDSLRFGALDLWMASDTRESNLWRDATLPDQINALTKGDAARDKSVAHDDDAVRESAAPRGGSARATAAWLRALLHALLRALQRNAEPALDAEVVFVQYWPTPPAGLPTPTPQAWRSPYFGALPAQLAASRVSVGFLHLHADGPATIVPSTVREAVRAVSTPHTRHALIADALSPKVWWRALTGWLTITRRLPTDRELARQITAGSDLATLWRWWRGSLRRSVLGSHAVRAALLTEMFGAVVAANRSTKLWVVAFEGQGWESCLARQLDAARCVWLPYVHTMMRPWDLRARTFLSEYRVEHLAIHGNHDRAELESLGVPLVEVEALRYQHLAATKQPADIERKSPDARTWLIVGGGDCERSNTELRELLTAMRRQGVSRHLVARWHPQCVVPTDSSVAGVRFSTEPLHELVQHADAAFMVGLAAPLDTYLAGVPSCYLLGEAGLEMSPIEENAGHHAAASADDGVTWMLAAEQQSGFAAPVNDFFVIDEQLPRWMSVIKKLVR